VKPILQNPFAKKASLKKDPAADLRPHVPRRDAESEEFINEYDETYDIPSSEKYGPALTQNLNEDECA
jgi:hypothetical protein